MVTTKEKPRGLDEAKEKQSAPIVQLETEMSNSFIRRIDSSVDGRRFYEGITVVEDEERRQWCYASVNAKVDAVYPKDSYLIQYLREAGLGGQAVFEKAGEDGTEAHIAIDALIRGEKVSTELMELKVKRCVQAFVDWAHEFKPQFIESEAMVVNHNYRYAGTRDLICKLNYKKGKEHYDGIYVVDYKTSSSIHDKHKITTAAYWACADNTAHKAAILHLGNRTKAGYSFLPFNAQEYWEKFKHYNSTFEMEFPNAEPKMEVYPDFFTL